MPYPSQVTSELILAQARAMVEAEGVDNLSLHQLAAALNVKAPSLYRYFANKTALLRALNDDTFRGIFRALQPAFDLPADAEAKLLAVAKAYRAYAHANPISYGLAYTNTIAELRPDEAEQEQSVLPFQAIIAEISGEEYSLPALRGYLALLHGFVTLELAQQFRRGGDLDDAFIQSAQAYLRGWR